jgi:predicted nucleotidyltransferase
MYRGDGTFLNFLTDRLGVSVDLVMRDALKPYIGKQILKEIVAV